LEQIIEKRTEPAQMPSSCQLLDETGYWLELLVESQIIPSKRLSDLQNEADQLLAIFISIVKKKKK